jgi:predicted DCC family thiol-disulfide oxidoreductase YuxK
MFKHPLVVTFASYLPMMFLIFFPMALMTRLKLFWIAVGILFHVNIAITMGLVTFATVMIGLELFMITDAEYHRLGEAVRSRLARVRAALRVEQPAVALFIDGFCPHCVAAGSTISALDVRGKVRVSSFRHDLDHERYGLTGAELERRMQAVVLASGRVHAGFDAVRLLAREMVALWPLRPVLALIDRAGWGMAAYDWLAARRRILPDPEACRGVCPVPAELGEEAGR